MSWYKDWFGEDYLKVYPHRNEAEAKRHIDFVERLLEFKTSERILDLGCGGGRHANELTQRGYHVTCLDLSWVLLSLARQRYGGQCCIRFVRADMRHIPFINVFDHILSFFTTFGYFETDAENLMTLKNIAAALKPEGRFLQDYMNKTAVLDTIVPSDSREIHGVKITQQRKYDRKKERIEKKITIQENGQTREYVESVRLYSLAEMKDMLHRAGLTLRQTFGDFDGSVFTESSPRLILFGSKEKG